VTGYYGDGNEHLDSIKRGEFLDYLSDYCLLKDSGSWTLFQEGQCTRVYPKVS
jgi:hypothetical protein